MREKAELHAVLPFLVRLAAHVVNQDTSVLHRFVWDFQPASFLFEKNTRKKSNNYQDQIRKIRNSHFVIICVDIFKNGFDNGAYQIEQSNSVMVHIT